MAARHQGLEGVSAGERGQACSASITFKSLLISKTAIELQLQEAAGLRMLLFLPSLFLQGDKYTQGVIKTGGEEEGEGVAEGVMVFLTSICGDKALRALLQEFAIWLHLETLRASLVNNS